MKLILIAAALLVQAPVSAQTGDLVKTLVSQLGVTEKQASGGAGSILGYARDNLSTDDFSKVTNAVPETKSLLSAAPVSSSAGSGLAGGNLGGTLAAVAGAAVLADSFQKLGLPPEMVTRFAPVVVNYVSSKGGSTVGSILGGALGGILGVAGPAPAGAPAAAALAAPTPIPPTATPVPAKKAKRSKKASTK